MTSFSKKSTQNPLISEMINEKWKCLYHKENYLHFIHLNINSKAHRICSECKIENQIDDREILSIHELLQSNETALFSNYPVIKDNQILRDLRALQSECDDIFSQVKSSSHPPAIIKSLEGVMRESKELYKLIFAKDKLIEAILSQAQQSEDVLHDIILELISRSQTNSEKISQVVERFSKIIFKASQKINSKGLIHEKELDSIDDQNYHSSKQKLLILKIGIKWINELNPKDQEQLFYENLAKFKGLTYLELNISNDCFDQNSDYSSLSLALIQLINLNSFKLSFSLNKINSKGSESLISILVKLKNIFSLQLSLECCDINAEGAILLSSVLSQLQNLNFLQLNLGDNKLSLEGQKSFFLALSQLKNLKFLILNLSFNNIGNEETELLSSALSQLKNLNVLLLLLRCGHHCFKIDQAGAKSLSSALNQLRNLNTLQLDLGNNEIGENGTELISSVISKLLLLNSLDLDLSCNNIDKKGVEFVSLALKKLKNLNSLKLDLQCYYNQYNMRIEVVSLSSAISQLKSLNYLVLNLEHNNIGSEGAESLFQSIKQLTNLNYLLLDLFFNNIYSKGAQSLASALSSLTNLNSLHLDLRTNNIGQEGAESLSLALCQLTNLISLQLSFQGNNIGKGVESLSSAFSELTNLNFLDLNLYYNQIGQEGAEFIISAISKLKNLNSLTLDLRSNHIGENAELLSQQLNQLKSLRYKQVEF